MSSLSILAERAVAAIARGDEKEAKTWLEGLAWESITRPNERRLCLREAGIIEAIAECMVIYALNGRARELNRLYGWLLCFTDKASAQAAMIEVFRRHAKWHHTDGKKHLVQRLFKVACYHANYRLVLAGFRKAEVDVVLPAKFGPAAAPTRSYGMLRAVMD